MWLSMGKVICSIAVPAPCLNLRLNGCFIKPFFPSCSRGLRMYALVLFIKKTGLACSVKAVLMSSLLVTLKSHG